MNPEAKPIRLSRHAQGQLAYRGANQKEVEEAIRTSPWGLAELGKKDCRKNFLFNQIWNGRYYATKQVRPIFLEEKNEVVVVTVYVYYF